MDENPKRIEEAEKMASGVAPVKSFMTAGPTLHYSHTNVLWLWFLTGAVYIATCVFWSTIVNGGPIAINLLELANTSLFDLGECAIKPISIYEYPWQIAVLGILMGILAVLPLLISQLLSFRYSIPLILAVMFLAKLYLFGGFVLISCIAVASRPLRFRSRFISLALCMAPQLIYWAIWGSDSTAADPIRRGFSFAPWIYAWLSGLMMAGIILGIGHFTRYKPGLNFLFSLIFLAVAFVVFQNYIGFAELDYHRYVASNNPADAVEFQDQSISSALDEVLADIPLRSRLQGQFFKFNNPAGLRLDLKMDIQDVLPIERWPGWFRSKITPEMNFQAKRQELVVKYEQFMKRWPGNKNRLPTVLYFRAILSETRPDERDIVNSEMLRFYSDYPFADNIPNWRELFEHFSESDEAIEARWRVAIDEARKGRFDDANEICDTTKVVIKQVRDNYSESEQKEPLSIFAPFKQPAPTIMTPFKLDDIERRICKLQCLIRKENQGDDEASKKRLSHFMTLNPYDRFRYAIGLDGLLEQMSQEEDGLRDNILLEKALLMEDLDRRLERLEELADAYPERDGGIRAKYEMGMTKIKLWKNETEEANKKKLLVDARRILSDFTKNHDNCPYSEQGKETLKTLPLPK